MKGNLSIWKVLISIFQAISLGVYVNFLTNELIKGTTILKSLLVVNNWNYIILLNIVLIYVQFKITNKQNKYAENVKEKIVEDILKIACKALVFPHKSKHIRAIVTICDFKKNKRITKYTYNVQTDPERTAIYDLNFGVTGEALRRRVPVAKELDDNHMSDYTDDEKVSVAEQLKSIVAAPIFSKSDNRKVIAVLAFDSFDAMNKIKLNSEESIQIVQSLADALTNILQ